MNQFKTLLILWVFNAFLQSKLTAQTGATNWKTTTDNLFSISYPTTNWQPFTDSVMGAVFTLSTTATARQQYDKDLIKLRIMNNSDNLYGDLDAYTAQFVEEKKDKTSKIVRAERIKKGQLEYHEKIEKNDFGKIKRLVKERYFFVNQKVYELTFDAEASVFNARIAQVDSIFNAFVINDFAATTVVKWENFNATQFELNYPNNWKLAETLPAHAEFMLNVPKKSTDIGYWDNIYLMVNTFKETTPELGDFSKRATEQLKTALKNGTIVQSTRKKSANFAYQEVISEGYLGKNQVRMKQWHIVKGKKAYTLTYTARLEHFEDLIGTVNEIFNSFKLR
jgi:hypothetical protein